MNQHRLFSPPGRLLDTILILAAKTSKNNNLAYGVNQTVAIFLAVCFFDVIIALS
jgi:hypothetical protein